MNIHCPYCAKGITYNVNLTGKTIKCPNCQKPVFMIPLNNLPNQYKKEYLEEKEEQAYLVEQALIRQKEEEKIRKQQEQQLEIAKRRQLEIENDKREQEVLKLEGKWKQEELRLQSVWEKQVAEAKRHVPEDDVKINYLWLSILATIYSVAGVIGLLGCIFILLSIPKYGDVAFIYFIYVGLASVTCLAAGEMLHLIINVANDTSGIKALLKRIAYPKEETKPSPVADGGQILGKTIHNSQ